jgi:transposase
MDGTVTMSKKELHRAEVVGLVSQKRMTQLAAAERLGMSERQLRRLLRAFETGGIAALASKKRGSASNHQAASGLREATLKIVRERYSDFGPTLAHEKLTEIHGLRLSVECLRKWMSEDALWITHRRRRVRIQQPRRRRDCFGELVQIDGSDHEWFEERAPRCTLLVFIDDATSRILQLYFAPSESTFSYFNAIRRHLKAHGKPVAYYSDKAAVFRVNAPEPQGGDGFTQFGRALSELNIDIICANTPTAKGRVERANLTLQDRLVKELRLQGMSDVDTANAFAFEFIEDFNRRFAKMPHSARDAHRALLDHENLDDICQWREERKVTKQLSLNYRRVMYLLVPTEAAKKTQGRRVQVYEDEAGNVEIRDGTVVLAAKRFERVPGALNGAVVENKLLSGALLHIQNEQRKRDAELLRKGRLTKRDKRLLAERRQTQAPQTAELAAE